MRTAALRRDDQIDANARGAEIAISAVAAVCDRLGVLHLPDEGILVVSDLHLEKGAAFARRGMPLPPYDTALTLALLESALDRYRPRLVVSLGDSFHDRAGAAHIPGIYRERLVSLMAGRAWCWVSGNHDPDRPADLPGDVVEALHVGPLTFRHEPQTGRAPGEIAGHLHPQARVVRRGSSVRRPCFATDGERLVMPAFGVMTGGLDLAHPAFRTLFDRSRLAAHVLGRDRIYSIPHGRLVA